MQIQQESRNGAVDTAPVVASQHALACWSRAWTQLAHGMMGAATAQIDFAREVLRPAAQGAGVQFSDPRTAAHAWVHLHQERFEKGVKMLRKMNDELAASMFAAADTLAESLEATASPLLPGSSAPAEASVQVPH